jgi:hypothetical protein
MEKTDIVCFSDDMINDKYYPYLKEKVTVFTSKETLIVVVDATDLTNLLIQHPLQHSPFMLTDYLFD